MCNKRNAEGSDCFTQWRNNLSAKGTPQGGILSPLLSNIVLNELDWWIASQWEKQPAHNIRDHITKTGATHRGRAYDAFRKSGLKEMHMVRYADDFKIFCSNRKDAKERMKQQKRGFMTV